MRGAAIFRASNCVWPILFISNLELAVVKLDVILVIQTYDKVRVGRETSNYFSTIYYYILGLHMIFFLEYL